MSKRRRKPRWLTSKGRDCLQRAWAELRSGREWVTWRSARKALVTAMPGTHRAKPYRRGDGTPVRGYTARNPGQRKVAAVTVATAVTIGFLTFSGSLPLTGGAASGGSEGVSVEVSADLNQAVAALAVIGFHGTRVTSSSRDCAANSTGAVERFLARHPCDKLILAGLTVRGQEAAARIGISWVTMPSTNLATRYKNKADSYRTGNPPEPPGRPRFNGLCYASGQNGATVWTAQIQPVGHPAVRINRGSSGMSRQAS